MSNKKITFVNFVLQIIERIEQTRESLGYSSKKAFCDAIGFSDINYTHITGKRKSKPPTELIHAIVTKFPNVSADWIITGKGEMFGEKADLTEIDRETQTGSEDNLKDNLINSLNILVEELRGDKKRLNETIDRMRSEIDELKRETEKLRRENDELKRELAALAESKNSA